TDPRSCWSSTSSSSSRPTRERSREELPSSTLTSSPTDAAPSGPRRSWSRSTTACQARFRPVPRLACEAFATFEEYLEAPCARSFTDSDQDFIEGLLDDDSDLLYTLSGGKVTGRCTRTVRLC